jgi:cytochrome c oxidase subunit 2
MKMDAVPGIPTTLWFTPKWTTEEMKVRTGNPNFVYEIACDQICGKGHFSMRGIIIIESQQEYDKWMAGQQSEYVKAMTPAPATPPASDSAGAAKPVAALTTH